MRRPLRNSTAPGAPNPDSDERANGRFDRGLERRGANHVALSPLSFLRRAAQVHGDCTSLIDGERSFTWRDTAERCRRLCGALQKAGVGSGDVVAILAPNITAMYEAHFGVPLSGAVLAPLNVRLDAAAVRWTLEHSQARMLIVDVEFARVAREALAGMNPRPMIIDIEDPLFASDRVGEVTYEAFLAGAEPANWNGPADEWDAISLNYTSGTTGEPKGVVYHHRGAYLNALDNVVGWPLPRGAAYLWSLPMFHCDGWCFPWSMAAVAGINICLRHVRPGTMLDAIERHGPAYMCAAPIVFAMLLDEAERRGKRLDGVAGQVAGAPPSPALLEQARRLGLSLTHVYGLTEVYGPASICEEQPAWTMVDDAARAALMSRQGVASLLQDGMAVVCPDTMRPVAADGVTVGEIMFRGNIVMKGYLDCPKETVEAFAGGWFHTGDLAVVDPDGYVRIVDRAKDVIISGGENISSVEIENVLQSHPAVLAAAVVAKADPKWGEVPCAFVELREGATASEDELYGLCRQRLAGFKQPKWMVLGALPRTSTGKVRKFELRATAGDLARPIAGATYPDISGPVADRAPSA